MSSSQITARVVVDQENGEFNWIKTAKTAYTPKYKQILVQRQELPVFRQREEFLKKYQRSRVVVLTSDTGSGKTTEIPPLVYFNDQSSGLQVVCTQPRRTAATSVATRVADVLDVELGKEVGYKVRFDDKTSHDTKIIYATDGILLREFHKDQTFSKYSCIIVDEAHERNVNSDILMGMLKYALTKRVDLRVIIMSATLDAQKFKDYYPGADALHIQGRTRPVAISYLSEATLDPNYFFAAMRTAISIHMTHDEDREDKGHILIFLPGEEDIQRGCVLLRMEAPSLHVLPFYSSLARDEQDKVFRPVSKGTRKCVLSTNIAEASVTIPDIAYVIDTGIMKTIRYNPRAGMEMLETTTISKAAAQQRAGRGGRTREGQCFRLYTKETYDRDFIQSTVPEIMTSNMAPVVLRLKGVGWNNVLSWPFIDPPAPELLFRALEDLHAMALIDDTRVLTAKGKQAANMSIDPAWFVAIDEGHRLKCSSDMVTLAAIFGIQNSIFVRPWHIQEVAAQAKTFFSHPLSEHMAYLNAVHAYVREKIAERIDIDQWCRDHFISHQAMEQVLQLRAQFIREWEVEFGPVIGVPWSAENTEDGTTAIRKALARGFSHQVAFLHAKGYVTVHGKQHALLSTDSPLAEAEHKWVIYDKFRLIGKQNLLVTTAVEPEWLMDLPVFRDDRWHKDHSGMLKQQYAKDSLDAARTHMQSSSGASGV